jgi:hypothetical protein
LPKSLQKGQGKSGNPARISMTVGDLPIPTVKLKFADIDPFELARQLTLIEFDLFSKIQVIIG